MTFRRARNRGRELLRELPNPELEAELLLLHVSGFRRHRLVLELDSPVPGGILDEYFRLVELRAGRVPLQHLTGSIGFMGREFVSGPGALIPRPETEMLVSIFIGLLREPRSLLDVGTGSGVIAVTLALEFPGTLVVGSDVSMEALGLAVVNARKHRTDNLELVRTDLVGSFREASFDGVAANLPYVPSVAIGSLQPEVRIWDPRVALDGGSDGLRVIRRFLDSMPVAVRDGGLVALELDPGQVEEVAEILEKSVMFRDVGIHRDLAGMERFVTARKVAAEDAS